MVFGTVNINDLGFVVIDVQGVLDMPIRKGKTIYDWGDKIEALVHEEDISFKSRNIEVLAFFDYRINNDFRNSLSVLKEIETTEILTTEYGDYICELSKIEVLKDFKSGGKTIKLTFIESNPDLSNGLPNTIGNGFLKIDGYDLINFGLLVNSVNGFDIPKLKSSKQTTLKNNYLSVFRDHPEIELKVSGVYLSSSDMANKINSLNKIFAKEGLRHFVHDGHGYQCFSKNGFKVKISKNIIKANIKLAVMSYYNIDEIVQLVIDQITIVASPQSDLTQTDNTKPDFIKGKDTWKASDSAKLNGQPDTYYAKESEMAGISGTDFAQQLENETNN